jgi:phosphonate transport system substrate-binding protein
MSNSGWIMPVYMLRQMGKSAEELFGRTIYTYSHDNSIRAVSDGLVDGAAVDSLVYEYALRQDSSLAARLRIIARSGANAIPPVVVRPTLDPGQKSILKQLFLTMHESPAGHAALAPLMIDRFVEISDSAYESVRNALREVREAK